MTKAIQASRDDEIRARWYSDRTRFKYRAYMSSALTSMDERARDQQCSILEDLHFDVFDDLGVYLYLPHVSSHPGVHADLSPQVVYTLDRYRIAQSSFLVASADLPSIGVGQEIEIAQALGIPIIGYAPQAKKELVSRMVRGVPLLFGAPGGEEEDPMIWYRNIDDLHSRLRERTIALLQTLPEMGSQPVIYQFGAQLQKIMVERDTSEQDLASALGVPRLFIRALSSSASDIESLLIENRLELHDALPDISKFTNPGFWVLVQLAEVLQVDVSRFFAPSGVTMERAQRRAIEDAKAGSIRHLLERGYPMADLRHFMVDDETDKIAARIGDPRKLADFLEEDLRTQKDGQVELSFGGEFGEE